MKSFTAFWLELKQRGVISAIVVYAVAGFVVLLAADLLAVVLPFPVWLHRLLIKTALIGIPVTLFVAWSFDLRRAVRPVGGRDLDAIEEEERTRTTSVFKMAGMVAAILGVALVGGAFFTARETTADLTPGRIAVAPLDNRMGDEMFEPLGAIAADWASRRLVQSRQLDAVPFDALLAYTSEVRGRPNDPAFARAIAQARGVGAGLVVWGAYYMQGTDSIRFVAQLMDVRSGDLVRDIQPVTAPFTNPMAGVARLRENIAYALSLQKHTRLGFWSESFAEPPRLPAYQRYLEGIRQYVQHDYDQAATTFADAYATDTTFVSARIWQARALADANQLLTADSVAGALEPARPKLTTYERGMLDYVQAQSRHDKEDQYAAATMMLRAAPASDDAARLLAVAALAMNHPREARTLLLGLRPDRGWAHSWDGYYSNLALAYDLIGDYHDELKIARAGKRRFPTSAEIWLAECRAFAGLHRITQAREIMLRTRSIYRHELTPGSAYLYCGQEMASHGEGEAAVDFLGISYAWFKLQNEHTLPRAARADYAYVLALLQRNKTAYDMMKQIAAEDMPAEEAALMRAKLALIAAMVAQRDEATAIDAELAALPDSLNSPYVLLGRARLAAELGQKDRAWEFLSDALQDGLPYASANSVLPTADYALRTLRRNPIFRTLYRPRG